MPRNRWLSTCDVRYSSCSSRMTSFVANCSASTVAKLSLFLLLRSLAKCLASSMASAEVQTEEAA